MALLKPVLSKFTRIQDLKNNNWLILDLLGNIYEIYVNLTVINLLNLYHFWITQAGLCLKGTFVKASFMLVTILFRYLWKYQEKNCINPSYP